MRERAFGDGPLFAGRRVIVTCGPGGVGKTTISAALASAQAVRTTSRVLVLTVDPARRLANVLGLTGVGNLAHRVGPRSFEAIGIEPLGELWVAMLDTRQSWDALIRRHAPDAATAEEILRNDLYRTITERFASSHEYIAMERLYEIAEEGDFDLVVVDTPPAPDALSFLDSPEKMADFFSSRLLRWLTVPMRSRLVSAASRPFSLVADRLLGTRFVEDIGRFFTLFETMYDGFVVRANAVSALLRDDATAFAVVTTPEPAPAYESGRLVERLVSRALHPELVVVNKRLPPALTDPAAERVAEAMRNRGGELAELLCATDDNGAEGSPTATVDTTSRVLERIGQSFIDFSAVARREQKLVDDLAEAQIPIRVVDHRLDEVVDLKTLIDIG